MAYLLCEWCGYTKSFSYMKATDGWMGFTRART